MNQNIINDYTYNELNFLLHLFEDAVPSKAAAAVANSIDFSDKTVQDEEIEFEKKIIDESNRNKTSQYGDVAVLLAMIAEIKEQMGEKGMGQEIFAIYKRKFPRHSSFQAEMKNYFGIRG